MVSPPAIQQSPSKLSASYGMMLMPPTYQNRSIQITNQDSDTRINHEMMMPTMPQRVQRTFQVSDKLAMPMESQRLVPSSSKQRHAQQLSPKSRRQMEWCDQVRNLKKEGSSRSLSVSAAKKTPPLIHKPFGNFRNLKKKEEAKRKGTKHTVRFELDESLHDLDLGHSTDFSSSTTTSASTCKASSNSALSLSSRRKKGTAPPSSTMSKSKLKRLFWSFEELEVVLANAEKYAEAYRTLFPSVTKQMDQLFEEMCSSANRTKGSNNESLSDLELGDEKEEEALREFLFEWADSDMRGLEEIVTTEHLLREDSNMAVGSVLAYQESLRSHNADMADDHVAEQIRARSESASHRARMFAMYMALGDAAIVAGEWDNQSSVANVNHAS